MAHGHGPTHCTLDTGETHKQKQRTQKLQAKPQAAKPPSSTATVAAHPASSPYFVCRTQFGIATCGCSRLTTVHTSTVRTQLFTPDLFYSPSRVLTPVRSPLSPPPHPARWPGCSRRCASLYKPLIDLLARSSHTPPPFPHTATPLAVRRQAPPFATQLFSYRDHDSLKQNGPSHPSESRPPWPLKQNAGRGLHTPGSSPSCSLCRPSADKTRPHHTRTPRPTPAGLTLSASGLHARLDIRQSGLFSANLFDLRCILTGC
jgi:hypothetical protein